MSKIGRADPRTNGAAARLRDDIDSGRTGDKVAFPDPAAAPLGTDDEAGGTSPDARLVERERAQLRVGPVGPNPIGPDPGERNAGQSSPVLWAIIAVIAAFAAACGWAVLR